MEELSQQKVYYHSITGRYLYDNSPSSGISKCDVGPVSGPTLNVHPDACAVSFERPPATCTDACLHYETSTAFSFIIVAKRLLVVAEKGF